MPHRITHEIIPILLLIGCGLACCAPPRLAVSENRRFLVTADGTPIFYLGDTAWELFHRLNRQDAEYRLMKRAERGGSLNRHRF